jgi:hypothetical protein
MDFALIALFSPEFGGGPNQFRTLLSETQDLGITCH